MRRLILIAFAFLMCGGAAIFIANRVNGDPAIPVALAVAVAGGVLLGATFRGRRGGR